MHQAPSETQGDAITRKCAPRATAKFSKSLSTDGKSGKVKSRTLIMSSGRKKKKNLKGKGKMFKILKPTFLGKAIPKEEPYWVMEGSTPWHFLQLGHLPWPSSWGENATVVSNRHLSCWVTVTVFQTLSGHFVSVLVSLEFLSLPGKFQVASATLLRAHSPMYLFPNPVIFILSTYKDKYKSENEREG